MAKALRNKFASQVSFLSGFSFLSGMTRIAKEKLCYHFEKHKYSLGQEVISEGDYIDYVYLIEQGEFEVSKTLYLHKKRDATYAYYMRSICKENFDILEKVFTEDSKVLFTEDQFELYHIKKRAIWTPK